ncbi:alpha/beta fold hydrolase [Halococcoides cellulosivorans]|uniref:Epoxide hydrolase n=1 Tax=Halococcoides cellulosivorans TaxID=1679096 RepID=A0A2R4X0M4_9EURY|nr:alpha/beta hydrolase [Halococcoides cellulosivorans]AWB27344.1 epoxide hydrolase [Halococcoides cellulosivorans]
MATESLTDAEPIDADFEDAPWTHGSAEFDDVDIHYVEAGPSDGPIVVLLHGFPECWWTWHHQIPALAEAGFHVVAMDMRGANRSSKPASAGSYGPDHLAGDVLDLIEHFGGQSARIVGHDFGGLVAWHLGHVHSDAVERLAVLNSPHLSVYGHHLTTLAQLRRSWYVGYFQIPKIPEWGLARDDFAIFESIYDGTVDPDALTTDDVERLRRAFARPGTPTGVVNWYRGVGRWYARELFRARGVPEYPVDVPTLLCWGEDDEALVPALVADHHDWIGDLRVERFPEASHWVHFEEREAVTAALLDHL